MENLGCYVPNSSGYGDLLWKTAAPTTATFRSNSGNQEHLGGCHSPLTLNDFNMGSFSLSPIDFEPLPNLFSFGPCPATYKDFPPVYKEKNPHDMADVLLSLKHAVVHPGQMAPLSPASNFANYGQQASSIGGTGPQTSSQGATRVSPTSVSFSVHPQAQIMSPHAHHGYTTMSQYGHHPYSEPTSVISSSAASGLNPSHQNMIGASANQGNLFPSMSVNVSMNMTMGVPPGISAVPNPYNMMEQMGSPPHHQQQLQWGSPSASIGPSTTSTHPTTSFVQAQNLMGPLQMSYSANPASHSSYGPPGSYSFTAEFRPNSACNDATYDKDFGFKNVSMNVTPFKPLKTATNYSFSPVQKRPTNTRLPGLSTTIVNRNLLREDFHLGQTLSESASKVNLCRICGKTYARPSTLKTHMRTHSGEKPYRCSTCSKSFSQAANLTAHIRTHSGEKPFRCPICDRRFSQSSSVTTHMRTHSGERPYRCRMCKKAFSDSSTLTKHLRIHSGEKPYQCTLCLLRFSQSGNLNRHMRVHSNPI